MSNGLKQLVSFTGNKNKVTLLLYKSNLPTSDQDKSARFVAEKSRNEIKSIADEAFGDKSLMKIAIYMIKKVEALGIADDQHYFNPKKSNQALVIITAATPPPALLKLVAV